MRSPGRKLLMPELSVGLLSGRFPLSPPAEFHLLNSNSRFITAVINILKIWNGRETAARLRLWDLKTPPTRSKYFSPKLSPSSSVCPYISTADSLLPEWPPHPKWQAGYLDLTRSSNCLLYNVYTIQYTLKERMLSKKSLPIITSQGTGFERSRYIPSGE